MIITLQEIHLDNKEAKLLTKELGKDRRHVHAMTKEALGGILVT